MTTYYVNGKKTTKEELSKIEITSGDVKRILEKRLGGVKSGKDNAPRL